jgi:hypothetical protein
MVRSGLELRRSDRAAVARGLAAERRFVRRREEVKGTIDLGTFAELGVALVGFTALIAVFRGGSVGSWHPRARMALWYIVAHGLGAVLVAMLPSLLAVVQVESWAGALAVLGLFHAATYGDLLRRHIVLLSEGISTPNL